MPVIFKSDGHIYESLNEDLEKDQIKWTSVTSFVGMFKPKFDAEAQSKKSSKNKRSKWYKIPPKKIQFTRKFSGKLSTCTSSLNNALMVLLS